MAASCLGYTGCHEDPVTGGYPLGNGYRTYLPGIKRFSCPDEASPFGLGGVNPYAYCEADPINRADPSGHFGERWIGALKSLTTILPIGARRATQSEFDELEEVVVHNDIPEVVVQPVPPPKSGSPRLPAASALRSQAVSTSTSPAHLPAPLSPALEPVQVTATGEVVQLIPPDSADGKFRIARANANDPRPRTPDGHYIYVNLETSPDKLFMMRANHPPNQGHVSISRYLYNGPQKAHYAGEISFSRGKIQWYNFQSGHYKPPEQYADFIPHGPARRLLPRKFFKARSSPL